MDHGIIKIQRFLVRNDLSNEYNRPDCQDRNPRLFFNLNFESQGFGQSFSAIPDESSVKSHSKSDSFEKPRYYFCIFIATFHTLRMKVSVNSSLRKVTVKSQS